jgi:hypothetical protein
MPNAEDSRELVRLAAIIAIVAVVSMAVAVGLRMWR